MSQRNKPVALAVALEYDGDSAPRVTAKGRDALAEKILQVARKHGIPIQENQPLASILANIELGEEIPESLYLAVAQVIAFAYYLSGKVPEEPGTE
ncbi:flagellar biosynthesis protein [Thiogranum longum]|uniref:Flagellar biosynthetic protein FlhB n=1 Tax=Thiogranum longum TaxID=1537524 RepID=A0A4R1HER1_9GAMM|nr:EscU/YscU/HrcU family type III secretion system export apparatus switch protein [Thiogranum longum]TCK18815.1 flagellar biosynthesis protein [Thiogranum longum]